MRPPTGGALLTALAVLAFAGPLGAAASRAPATSGAPGRPAGAPQAAGAPKTAGAPKAAGAPKTAAASPGAGTPARPAAEAPAGAHAPQLKDRVLAIVDEDPILASDLERVIGLGLAQPHPGESERAFRRRVLDDLIAQRVRFHELDRFGFQQVPVDEIEKHVAEIRARFPGDAAFAARLKELGLDLPALRQLVARQLEVLTYVDERLGPEVFVSLDDIVRYYHDVLTPEMQRQSLPVPPLDDVREKIREVLRQQRLNDEIEHWTEELRRKATIAVFFDQPVGGPLPPVVKRFEASSKQGRPPRR